LYLLLSDLSRRALAHALLLLVGLCWLRLLHLTCLFLLLAPTLSLFLLFLLIICVSTSLGIFVRIDGEHFVNQLLLDGLTQVFLDKHVKLSAEMVPPDVALLVNLL